MVCSDSAIVMEMAADLEALLASKEREWKELQVLRIQQLETALAETSSQLTTQRERFLRLREDFQFNLRVLEERDRELERYDAMAARVHTEDHARQEKVSQLCIQVAKLQESVEAQTQLREDLQQQYHKRGVEHRLQLERIQSVKDGEIQRLREENEALKRDLQRHIQASDGQLALQKQEMMSDFESEMRSREHGFNLRMDEMRNIVLSHELKVKLLCKEMEVHAKAHSHTTEALQSSEQLCQQAHKDLQHREWELNSITAAKDSCIKELEEKVNQLEAKRKSKEEINNRKHAELERRAREKEAALDLLQEAHSSELREEKTRREEVKAQLDLLRQEQERLDRSHADELLHKEQQLQELRTQIEATRTGWDTYITQVSKETVAKDTALLSAEEREAKLKAELQKCKEDVERYRQQVSSGVQREQALEQRRVQLELDWERRCEEARSEHYVRGEELIQGLTRAKEQAAAELREKERELQETTAVLRSVRQERDQALQRARGDPNTHPQAAGMDGSGFPSEEIQRLQQQNSSLRAVVAQMRRDMESLSSQPPPTQDAQPVPSTAGTAEYNQALEEELKGLKARCRQLEDQLEEASKAAAPTPTSVPLLPISPDNAYLQNHVRSLNETIGGLRTEKVATAAVLRKQEVRLAHLESAVAQLTQQCHAKQMESEELRMELANQKRSWVSEEAGLRQRLAAAEMELKEVRKEAEEYQKASLLHNLETVALGNQVSALKLDIASKREPIVLEQSEVVRQLQEDNLHLRRQLLIQGAGPVVATGDASHLHAKLKQAARWISRLSQDKQQLIEMGNRLRAHLAQAGLDLPQHARPGGPQDDPSKPESDPQPPGRLSALEQLQYQLTTQELQYAQRDQCNRVPIIVRPHLTESESGDKDKVTNPWDLPAKTREPSSSKENTPPKLDQSEAPVRLAGPSHSLLSSSVGTDETLRDVWQMLDRGCSPSMLTPSESEGRDPGRNVVTDRGEQELGSTMHVGVQGVKAAVQERRKQMRPSSEPTKKTRPTGKSVKIRNYNLKD